jgi:hypothetical protein
MGVDAALPPGLFERVTQMIRDEIGKVLRSGLLRNASISEGGLTIKGGFLRMLSAVTGGVESFYVGPINPPLGDGSYQPGFVVRRNDGTTVLLLWDPLPGTDGYNQFLGWYDRTGNAIFTDDTTSGEGNARPWLALPIPQPTDISKWPSTSSTSWGTIAESFGVMQQPKLFWNATAIADAGVTAQVRLSIHGGATVGPVHTVVGGTTTFINDTISLPAGFYGSQWALDVQAQVTGGAGSVHVSTWQINGQQS